MREIIVLRVPMHSKMRPNPFLAGVYSLLFQAVDKLYPKGKPRYNAVRFFCIFHDAQALPSYIHARLWLCDWAIRTWPLAFYRQTMLRQVINMN